MSEKKGSFKAPAVGEKERGRRVRKVSLAFAILLALTFLIGMGYMWRNFTGEVELPQAVLILGQLHPVFVHLPIALLLVVSLMEGLSLLKPCRRLRRNTLFLLWLGTLGAAAAAVVGFMLKSTGEYSGQRMENHMWAGIGVAAGSLAALILKSGAGGVILYRLVLAATAAAVVVAGHVGGSVTHGSDYLTKHLPAEWLEQPFLRDGGLWGFVGANGESEFAGEEATGSGTIYDEYIGLILESKCVECHGEDKQKGKLRLDTYEFVMQGAEGSDYPTVVPGEAAESELIVRAKLPLEDDDHMPPEDDPQLTADELQLLEWWIAEGASAELTVAEVRSDEAAAGEEIIRILRDLEPKEGEKPAPAKEEGVAADAETKKGGEEKDSAEDAATAAALREVEAAGFTVLPVSAEDKGLQFNAVNVADEFDDAALSLFEPLAGRIVELDLGRTKITDEGAGILGKMSGLTRLHLEQTAITDAGLEKLKGLDALEYLNLYGTGVTDAGLEHLKKLGGLKRLYLWQTGVTEEGAEALRASREGIYVDLGRKEPPVVEAKEAANDGENKLKGEEEGKGTKGE